MSRFTSVKFTPARRAATREYLGGAYSELKELVPLARVALWITTVVTAALVFYGAWQRRWIADDGLIVMRTVRNLLAGNGPVFNVGERVEVNTSAAWTYLVWFFSWLSQIQTEYVVLTIALVLTTAAFPIAILGTVRLYKGSGSWQHLKASPTLFLPAGALIYIALPQARDFATSGLEVSLTIFWVAVLWWQTIWWAQLPSARARRRGLREVQTTVGESLGTLALAFNAGLSWLVRPEMALVGGLVLAVMFFAPIGVRLRVAITVAAAALPLGYQIFRMGYYALPVPNTAVAKDASGAKWGQGFTYLRDLVDPYTLWLPVVIAVVGALVAVATAGGRSRRVRDADGPEHGQARSRRPRRVRQVRSALQTPTFVVVLFVFGGVAEALYWLRQGGDFMSGRVLLAPLFLLLLPVIVLPLTVPSAQRSRGRGRAWVAAEARLLGGTVGAALAALAWVFIVMWSWKTTTLPGPPDGTVISRSGIVDERRFYSQNTGSAHPVTAQDYLGYPRQAALQEAIDHNPHGAAYFPAADFDRWFVDPVPYPTPRRVENRQTVFFLNLGMTSMNTDLSVRVLDSVGLAWPLATHTARLEDGRIGHDKAMFPDWVIAESRVVAKRPFLPFFIDPDWANQARVALTCPATEQLLNSSSKPLTWALFKQNVRLSVDYMKYRIHRVPEYAVLQCGLTVPAPLTPAETTIQPRP